MRRLRKIWGKLGKWQNGNWEGGKEGKRDRLRKGGLGWDGVGVELDRFMGKFYNITIICLDHSIYLKN